MRGFLSKTLAEITAEKVIANNTTDFFSADFTPERDDSIIRITIAGGPQIIQMSPSSGTAFTIRGGAALTLSTVYTEEVSLDRQRSWNMRTTNAGGITLRMVRIQEFSRT